MDKVPELIKGGAVGIIPTDTVYGLVASAKNPEAVAKLYSLKTRDKKPGTVIAASVEQLTQLGLKGRYLRAVESFWPGPVSVIIPCGEELNYLHLGLMGLAVRIPDDQSVLKLLRETGPLLTTSANLPGMPTATNIDEARQYFGDRADFYIDGGELNGKPSTLIKVIDDEVVVLRQGDTTLPLGSSD